LAWQDEMVPTLRVLIGDLDEDNPTNSDDNLELLLVVASKQVAAEAVFDTEFSASVDDVEITPDPTDAATQDDSFVNLVTLKAACILDRADARVAANRAVLVKDGSSAIDLSKISQDKLKLLKQGWCAVYEDALFSYQYVRTSGAAGAAVLGPFRLYAQNWAGGSAGGYGGAGGDRDRSWWGGL
jgi:hypothetical protein